MPATLGKTSVQILVPDRYYDLWTSTLLLASHARRARTGGELLHLMMMRERASIRRQLGAERCAEIEALYHKPRAKRTSKAPPPVPESFGD